MNNREQESIADTSREPRSDASVTMLIRHLADDVTNLFSREIALAKTEITQNLQDVKTGLVSSATGALVLYAGLLVLLAAAVIGLTNVMELWLAALVVGGIVTIVGFAMLGAGKSKMDKAALRPDHTIDSVKKTQHSAKGAMS